MSFTATEDAAALEDEALARRAHDESDAFAELYARYLKPIHRYVRSQVDDQATAEDLTAQIFFKSLVSASGYRGEGSYRSWIFQIARNTVATWKAKRGSEVPVDEFPEDAASDEYVDAPVISLLERDALLETLEELPLAQREVVRLRYWAGLTTDEIARVTRRSSGAVRQLLHRARRRLHKKLSAKGLTAVAGATGASAVAIYSIARHRKKAR